MTEEAGWLADALRFAGDWLDFQMRATGQPGCAVAIARNGALVFERAFGVANLETGERLTPRHRFRVASHSKTFTAAAIMLLRERGLLRLDDPVGRHVPSLSEALAQATIGQLMSHSAGLSANGTDQSCWNGEGDWPDEATLRRELSNPLVLRPGEQHKYSNLGYGLLGLVIEAVTKESFGEWISRAVVHPAGLHETAPDVPDLDPHPFANGHSGKLPVGRFVVEGRNRTNALAAATGFVATPGDLVRFFGMLAPGARDSVLDPGSRREMTRRHWKVMPSETEQYYGLGTVSGSVDGRDWFGHTGSCGGYQSRTCIVPELAIGVSVVINAVDGPASAWAESLVHILQRFSEAGPTDPAIADWRGRWWNPWGAVDLVPFGDIVVLVSPDQPAPLNDREEIEVLSPTSGRFRKSEGFRLHGEPIERTVTADGETTAIRVAGDSFVTEAVFVAKRR